MALRELQFSDLLLAENGVARLRGVPGEGVKIVPVPADCAEEVRSLPPKLREAWMQKTKQTAIRFEHDGRIYRVSRTNDVVSGQCWFMRRMAKSVPTLEKLGAPKHIGDWLMNESNNHGLVLFSGSQGAGKTTMASAFIKSRLLHYGGLAVTFESPAEMPLSGFYGDFGQCIQTEVDSEEDLPAMIQRSHTFAQPNIIFIGEIKSGVASMEALRASLGSKEQMVVATIHGTNVIAAIQRLVMWAQELDGPAACENLSQSISSIIQLSLQNEGPQKVLRVPEFLLVPFSGDFSDTVRAKLRTAGFNQLAAEINRSKNLLLHGNGDINQLIGGGAGA